MNSSSKHKTEIKGFHSRSTSFPQAQDRTIKVEHPEGQTVKYLVLISGNSGKVLHLRYLATDN